MAKLLTGAQVVATLNDRMKKEITALAEKSISPTLAILRVGERPDDIAYENSAVKRCKSVGVTVKSIVLPADVRQDRLMNELDSLNRDGQVHGILLFRPLPKHLDEETVRAALTPEKDVDGITDGSLAGVFTGSGMGFAPCTAQACIEILDYYGIDCTGKRAVVIGRSLVVGKPAAIMLLAKHATVTICHTGTVNMPAITRDADIVICAAGKPETITAGYFSENQVVIDVGINWSEEKQKLCGDVKFDEVEPLADAITPVPGGVGTVTTSVLISHVVEAAKRKAK